MKTKNLKKVSFTLKKTIAILTFTLLLFNGSAVYAQISSDQQTELNKYETLVNNFKNQKNYKMVGYYLYKSAAVYLKAGEHQNAINMYLESARYYEQIGNYNNKKKIYSNIAFVYAEIGQLKNAKKFYGKSLEISRRLNNSNDVSASLMEVASIEIYLQDYSKAQTNLEEALKIANSLNDAILLRACYRLLAQLHKANGNKKKSEQYYNNYLIYDKQVKGERAIKQDEMADKINEAEKDKAQKLSEKNEANTVYNLLELRKKISEDSLSNTIAVREDVINRIEGRNNLINKINKNLKQDSKYYQKVIDNLKRQLFWVVFGIVLLIILAMGTIVAFLKKIKAYKQLEQKVFEMESIIAKMKNELSNNKKT
ncbi:MAG: tetratricopeptide repeat protein [Bacteroidota bacterium]